MAKIYSYPYKFDAGWGRTLEKDDLDDIVHSGKGIGIEDLFKCHDITIIRNEIDAFLLQLLEESTPTIDSVVGIERKGYRIFRNFLLEHPSLDRVDLISSNKLELSDLSGKRVLVFDDSIHRGTKALDVIRQVKQLGAIDIRCACLLCNDMASSSISALSDVPVSSCKPLFSSYHEQSRWYRSWEVPYLSTLRVKDNPDYPMMVLRTECPDINEVDEAIAPCFDHLEGMMERCVNGDDLVDDDFINITVEYEPHSLIPHDILDKIAAFDSSKIRYLIRKHPDRIDVEIISLISQFLYRKFVMRALMNRGPARQMGEMQLTTGRVVSVIPGA